MRRYSHLGPVAQPRGMPLSARTMKILRGMYDRGIGWRVIANRCGVSRATLYRALCGGNVTPDTRASVRNFTREWSRMTATRLAKDMRRWSPARRAAQKTRSACPETKQSS